MKQGGLRSALVLFAMVLCNACVSRSLAPPSCDLATAVPINVSEASTKQKTLSVESSAPDSTESTPTQEQGLKDEAGRP